ncbi:MAG: hypothetical protein HZB33_03675 [Nitrospirae bacterium]|nr:hypothetical protein [Nitrospirota bacterium]
MSAVILCGAEAYAAASETVQAAPDNAVEEPGLVASMPGDPVVPYEFNDDVRNLPYYPLKSTASDKPYRPLLRPPSRPRSPLPSYEPEPLPISGQIVPFAAMPASLQNFVGMSKTDACSGGQCGSGYPPDTNGDVGPNHYIQAVNASYAIYDKAGNLQASFTEDNLWAGSGAPQCDGNSMGDPIVVYDPLADRWILSHFAFGYSGGQPVTPFYQCIAVSKTSNPLSGGWWLYALQMDPGGVNLPPVGTLQDYPKFGIWPDCLYMSANEFTEPGDTFAGTLVAAFSRSDLISGNTLTWSMLFLPYPAYNIFTMIPSNLLGSAPSSLPSSGSPNYFVSESQSVFGFEVRRFVTRNDCASGTFYTTPVTVAQSTYDYNSLGDVVPQLGTTIKLDALGDRLMQKVQFRRVGSDESLWVVHSVRPDTSSTVRPEWAEIDVTGGTVSSTAVQLQTYVPDTTIYRWMGSLAVDKDGNMALGYSTSSSTSYPGIAYSGRLVTDDPSTLPQAETVLIAGTGPQTGISRWGDYSAMSVDPSDDCTFWYTNEYFDSSSTSNWRTRIGSFRFPGCNPSALVRRTSDSSPHSGIGAAYSMGPAPGTLQLQAITFYEDAVFDRGFNFILDGGYNSTFLSNSGFTGIHGTLTIASGTVTINKVSLQ